MHAGVDAADGGGVGREGVEVGLVLAGGGGAGQRVGGGRVKAGPVAVQTGDLNHGMRTVRYS